jgi:hypothetical protein
MDPRKESRFILEILVQTWPGVTDGLRFCAEYKEAQNGWILDVREHDHGANKVRHTKARLDYQAYRGAEMKSGMIEDVAERMYHNLFTEQRVEDEQPA